MDTFNLDEHCVLTQKPQRGKLFHVLKHDSCIGRVLNEFDCYWEYWLIKYMHYLYKNYARNTNIIDVGANIGSISAIFQEAITEFSSQSDLKIFSFEPVYHQVLQKNVELNHWNNVQVMNYAVGKENGEIHTHMYTWDEPHNFGQLSFSESAPEVSHGRIPITLDLRTLDSFHFDNIGVIKIDVEGLEENVLIGAKETIERNLPILFVEIWNLESLQDSEIFKFLKSLGYYMVHLPSIAPTMHHDYVFLCDRKCPYDDTLYKLGNLQDTDYEFCVTNYPKHFHETTKIDLEPLRNEFYDTSVYKMPIGKTLKYLVEFEDYICSLEDMKKECCMLVTKYLRERNPDDPMPENMEKILRWYPYLLESV